LTYIGRHLAIKRFLRCGCPEILDVHWSASSYRTVSAVWLSCAALYKYFTDNSVDCNLLDSKEHAQFLGLARKLETPTLLNYLALMHDALGEHLQTDSICLPKANRLIYRQVVEFQSRKGSISPGYEVKILEAAIATKRFGDIIHTEYSKWDPQINRGQFYQALYDSITARMQSAGELSILIPQPWPCSQKALLQNVVRWNFDRLLNVFFCHILLS
jgi:hypothetical protein